MPWTSRRALSARGAAFWPTDEPWDTAQQSLLDLVRLTWAVYLLRGAMYLFRGIDTQERGPQTARMKAAQN